MRSRVARFMLYADRQASSVALFNKLHWIPFYEQCNIDKCSILYKRIHGSLPSYLDDHLVINYTNVIHGIHGTLISTLFVLNLKEKPKVDAHLQYPLQDSGTMYPYQEPITRSVQLPYSVCETAFSQAGLLDRKSVV